MIPFLPLVSVSVPIDSCAVFPTIHITLYLPFSSFTINISFLKFGQMWYDIAVDSLFFFFFFFFLAFEEYPFLRDLFGTELVFFAVFLFLPIHTR